MSLGGSGRRDLIAMLPPSRAWRCRLGSVDAGARRGLAALSENYGFVHVVHTEDGLAHASKGENFGMESAAGVYIRAKMAESMSGCIMILV